MKNGFTKLQLIFVIVVCFIAFIFSYNRYNILRKGTYKEASLMYMDAIEKQIIINEVDDDPSNDIKNISYTIEQLNNLGLQVHVTSPDTGWVKIENGKVKEFSVSYEKYVVDKIDEEVEINKNGKIKEMP